MIVYITHKEMTLNVYLVSDAIKTLTHPTDASHVHGILAVDAAPWNAIYKLH